MTEHTYGVSEIVGTATTSVDDAIRNGIAKASNTVRNLAWFEVVDVRGHIVDGEVGHVQVTMKLGFRIDD